MGTIDCIVGSVRFSCASEVGLPSQYLGPASVCVSMRPSIFLEIAPPLEWHELDWMMEHIGAGGAIHPAMLHLDPWPDHIGDGYPETVAHDGRHRMTCILDVCGDEPVPVLLRGLQADLLEPGSIRSMRTALWSQRDDGRDPHLVKGPVFERIALPGAVVEDIGLDELHQFIPGCG